MCIISPDCQAQILITCQAICKPHAFRLGKDFSIFQGIVIDGILQPQCSQCEHQRKTGLWKSAKYSRIIEHIDN